MLGHQSPRYQMRHKKNIRGINQVLSEKDAAAFALLVYHDKGNEPNIPDDFTLLCKYPIEMQNVDLQSSTDQSHQVITKS
jgi:hypothetical protein